LTISGRIPKIDPTGSIPEAVSNMVLRGESGVARNGRRRFLFRGSGFPGRWNRGVIGGETGAENAKRPGTRTFALRAGPPRSAQKIEVDFPFFGAVLPPSV
jgi:hypothetical protein